MKWTPEEDAQVVRFYGSENKKKLGKRLGRTPAALEHRAQHLGVTRDMSTPWTEYQIEVLRRRWLDTPTKDLARQLGRTPKAVAKMAEKLGLKGKPRGRRRAQKPLYTARDLAEEIAKARHK